MIKTYIVDSFTDKVFKGNPAGVCLIDDFPADGLMLNIAKELGLSETAFVKKNVEDSNTYGIRYFSPAMEIPLCGHATLASAKVIFDQYDDKSKIIFNTVQNLDLVVKQVGDFIEMEFPVYETFPAEVPAALLHALGIADVINCEFNKETNILLLEIEDSQQLQNLNPDFTALKKSHDSINGVLVTALSKQAEYDFESRYFWPWSGTNEDPVTGGTHTFLAKYWSERLNKSKMKSYQCSKRSGFMDVELISESKMIIRSQAQLVFSGELNI